MRPYNSVQMVLLSCLLALSAPTKPAILTRQEWGAKPTLSTAIPHHITRITIHHGGVPSNPGRSLKDKLAGLQAWSQRDDKLSSGKAKPAWPDIPYHFYIDTNGQIGEARPTEFAGDTNTEYNPAGHLLIMVEGDFDKEPLKPVQYEALKLLTLWCASTWNVRPSRIGCHKDFSKQTSCPGKNLEPKIPELRDWVLEQLRRS